MNSFEQFLVEFLVEGTVPHFKGSHKTGKRGKRAAGYSETERPGEDLISAEQDKATEHYQGVLNDPKSSEEDRRDAKQFLGRGPGWSSTSDRKKYGRGNKK